MFNRKAKYFDEMKNLFEFDSKEKYFEKLQILTLLLKSWTVEKSQSEFNITDYITRLSKKLVDEKGILSTPNSNPRISISDTDLKTANKFYLQDNVSRPMQGQNDFILVSTGQGKEKVQKRMMLYTIKEAYEAYCVILRAICEVIKMNHDMDMEYIIVDGNTFGSILIYQNCLFKNN